MTDLLDSIRQQLWERLDELRPLVSEYERLAAAEAALGAGASDRSASPDRDGRRPARVRRRQRSAGRRASTPASREANREKVLAIVGERPGVTKAELKEAVGLTGAGVAQNLRRLLDRGQLRQETLPGGEVGYRLGQPHAET